jgi:regulator of protease activity HflC (stomatin/prohibitin superfamily)
MGTYVMLGAVALVVILALKGFRIISQSETCIVERLGRYHRTLTSGINYVWPIIDRTRLIDIRGGQVGSSKFDIVITKTDRIDLREQLYDFPKQNVITKDNVLTEINALLYFQIMDPFKAIYEIDNLPNAIEKLTQTTLRNIIGELELDESLTSRDMINSKLRAVLDEATNKWGVKITRVELQDITPPSSVRIAMEQQMQAERKRRADILNAEGEKQSAILKSEGEKESQINIATAEKESQILRAQGEAEAKILQAEAEAAAIEKITCAIAGTQSDPASYLLATKYIETLKEMASGGNSKTVYLPYEATAMLGSVAGIKDLFEKSKK